MFALLPALALLLQTALFLRRGPLTEAFLKSCVALGVLVAVSTEVLSLGHGLSFGPVLGAWLIVLVAQTALVVARGSGRLPKIGALTREDSLILAAAAATALLCGLVVLLAPPNNFDSLSYHLPRVLHWVQNRSVAHYPANDLRQLAFPPGASFIALHLRILSGSMRWSGAPQWLAFLGVMAGGVLIARRLGAGKAGQTLALALAAALPMAVLQAQTTQNDLLTALWLVCFSCFALKDGDYESADTVWLSASLGLAILTKPTGLLFGAPLLLIVLARRLRRLPDAALTEEAAARGVGAVAAILALAGLLSVGHLCRNKTGLGSFLPEDGRTLKAVVGLRQTAAAAMKNAALELPLPPLWSAVLGVERHVLGLSPEDPGGNFDPAATRSLSALCARLLLPDEDFAGAPLHFLLWLWALGLLAHALWREREDPWSDRSALAAALTLGFLVFCAFFKWQEWANRLMLPLFLLAAPLTAQILEERLKGPARAAVLVYLGLSGLFYASTAVHRPLWPLPARLTEPWQSPSVFKADVETAYLSGYGRTLAKPVRAIVDTVVSDKCARLGLGIGGNDLEYVWWALLGLKGAAPVMIKNVGVTNASAGLAAEFPSADLCGAVESQGGVIMYFDAADMAKMHAAGHHEPPPISEIKN